MLTQTTSNVDKTVIFTWCLKQPSSLFHDGRLNHKKKTNPETRLEYLNHKLDQPRPAGSVEAPLPRVCLWTRTAVGAVGPGLPRLPSNKAEKSEGCPLIQTLPSFPSRVTLRAEHPQNHKTARLLLRGPGHQPLRHSSFADGAGTRSRLLQTLCLGRGVMSRSGAGPRSRPVTLPHQLLYLNA